MAGITAQVSGSNIIVTAVWEKPTAVSLATAGAAAEYLFNLGYGNHGTEENPRTFADLSNQEKLDLIYNDWTRRTKDLAKTFVSNKLQDEARQSVGEYDW